MQRHWGAQRARLLRRAGSEEEDLQALLAQAEALRREAAMEEEALKEQRIQWEEEESKQAREEAERSKEEAERDLLMAAARLSIAEGKVRQAEAEGKTGEELEALRGELQRARSQAQQAAPKEEAKPPQEAPDAARADGGCKSGGSCGSCSSPDQGCQTAKAPGAMSEAEWVDLAKRFEGMPWNEQFDTNKKLGPQGRRKLAAIREGKEGGVFIVEGARVTLLENPKAFRSSFKRFRIGTMNGYSDAKFTRRGQECVVRVTFQDGTFTGVFDDGTTYDFPWESVQGFDPSGAWFIGG